MKETENGVEGIEEINDQVNIFFYITDQILQYVSQ